MVNPIDTERLSVLSPAGETVTIIPDAVMIERKPNAILSSLRYSSAKYMILSALWTNGSVRDASGRATKLLHEMTIALGNKANTTSLNGVLAALQEDGFIYREIRGKRCYEIQLVTLAEKWYKRMPMPEEKTEEEWDAGLHDPWTQEPISSKEFDYAGFEESTSSNEVVTVPVDESIEFSVMSFAADKVAASLLEQCLTILQNQNTATLDEDVRRYISDISQLQMRLGAQIEDSQCLRRKLTEVSDELQAVKFERDGLRTKVRILEANVQAALTNDGAAYIQDQMRKAIDSTMREKPMHIINNNGLKNSTKRV